MSSSSASARLPDRDGAGRRRALGQPGFAQAATLTPVAPRSGLRLGLRERLPDLLVLRLEGRRLLEEGRRLGRGLEGQRGEPGDEERLCALRLAREHLPAEP
jgi:hypothetical protein